MSRSQRSLGSCRGVATFGRLSSFLESRRLSLATSSLSRWNSSSVLDAAAVPSNASGGAIEDLRVQLRYWGKSHLDAEASDMLLDNVGYAHPRAGLFESFLGDVLRALLSSAGSGLSEPPSAALLERGGATLCDVRRLYASELYRMPTESGLEDGGALMYRVGIDLSQRRRFLSELLNRRLPLEVELKEVRSQVPRHVRGGGENFALRSWVFLECGAFAGDHSRSMCFFWPIVSHENNRCILVLTFSFYPPEQK